MELADAIKTGQVSARQVVDESLEEVIRQKDLNIWIDLYSDQAQLDADLIDKKIKNNKTVGRLAGIPFSVKDNILVKDTQTTAAAPLLNNFMSPFTSTVAMSVLEEDAILLGKTNLDAFGHGGSTENTAWGPTKNPIDQDKVPGGSSGGSAVSVATDICKFSIGTDTGGSIRQPASFCGIVGYKPSYGLLSRYGVIAMASSTDCLGFLTKRVDDSINLIRLAAKKDKYDGTTFDSTAMDWELNSQLKEIRLAKIKQFWQNLEGDVAKAAEGASKKLESASQLSTVSVPSLKLSLACYYILVSAELSSNLSRYDGLRYGQQQPGDSYQQIMETSRGSGFFG